MEGSEFLHLHITDSEMLDLDKGAAAAVAAVGASPDRGQEAGPNAGNSPVERSGRKCDDEDEDDDDEEDNINVIIDENAVVRGLTDDAVRADTARNLVEDLELTNEMMRIVMRSVYQDPNKCVIGQVNNQLLMIPHDQPISDRLNALLWRSQLPYRKSSFYHMEHFNELLAGRSPKSFGSRDLYAVFSVRYRKTTFPCTRGFAPRRVRCLEDATQQVCRNANYDNEDRDRSRTFNIYRYVDFAAVIVRDNRIVDVAVHGAISNINEMIRSHNVDRVYYNAAIGDPLHTFMEYKYQPFYESCSKISRPVSMNRGFRDINVASFCTLHDPMCALCNVLRDTHAFVHNADVPNVPRLALNGLLLSAVPDSAPVSRRHRRRGTARRKRLYPRTPFGRDRELAKPRVSVQPSFNSDLRRLRLSKKHS